MGYLEKGLNVHTFEVEVQGSGRKHWGVKGGAKKGEKGGG